MGFRDRGERKNGVIRYLGYRQRRALRIEIRVSKLSRRCRVYFRSKNV